MSPAEFQYAYKQSARNAVPLFCVENSLFNSSLALPLPPPRASDGGRQLAAKIRCHRSRCSDQPDSRYEVRSGMEADRPTLQSRSFVDVASATMSADGVPTKPKSVRRCAIRTANFTGALRQTTGFILKEISGRILPPDWQGSRHKQNAFRHRFQGRFPYPSRRFSDTNSGAAFCLMGGRFAAPKTSPFSDPSGPFSDTEFGSAFCSIGAAFRS